MGILRSAWALVAPATVLMLIGIIAALMDKDVAGHNGVTVALFGLGAALGAWVADKSSWLAPVWVLLLGLVLVTFGTGVLATFGGWVWVFGLGSAVAALLGHFGLKLSRA